MEDSLCLGSLFLLRYIVVCFVAFVGKNLLNLFERND